jgi:hypothetical protein
MATEKKKSPTWAFVLLATGIIWMLNDLKIFTIDIPWFPVILIIIALSWIFETYSR